MTLRAELEEILLADGEFRKSKADAILQAIKKKLPKKKNLFPKDASKAKRHRDLDFEYRRGFHSAITDMEKALDG